MSPVNIIFILAVHWIADFVLQTDRMAKGKSTSNRVLAEHVTVYTGTFLAMTLFLWPSLAVVLWCVGNGLAHFCVDYVTSRVTSRLYKEGRIHDFFVIIGLDQAIHYSCLFLSWGLIS